MRRNILLSLSLALLSLSSSGQVSFRTNDLIRLGEMQLVERNAVIRGEAGEASPRKVDVIVRYSTDTTLDEIRAAGGEIVSLVGTRTAIVSVAPEHAVAMAASKGVTGAMLSAKLKHANNKALPASFVDEVHKGTNLDMGYDGTGVVVGLFDTGIDPNHINFTDADGKNRIKVVWNYPEVTAIPDVYDTEEKISTYDCDTRSESHGTHVLGIIAGSFRDPEADDTTPDYRGVAPGAEIVAASGDGYNAQILDAMERIGRYAQQQGKPCVINLSFGDNVGPHDGTDEFTEAINDIAAKYNAVICLAGGNERDEAIAIVKKLPEEAPEVKTLLVKGSTEMGGNFQTYGPIEVWTEDATPFDVTLDIVSRTAPDKPLYSLAIPEKKETYVVQGETINQIIGNTGKMNLIEEGTEFHTLYTNSFMGGIKGVDPYNKRYYARLNVYIEGRTSAAVSRNFVKLTVKGQPGKKIFLYCNGTYMNFGNRNIPGLDVPDGYGTNSNMASGPNTIAVGSYVTANYPESGYPAGTVGTLSYFSSYGETLDGRVMPDVCAPGQVIVSSRNTYLPTSATYLKYYPLIYSYKNKKTRKTYNWTTCGGTSQSSPHMAGIAALWLQANPNLTFDEVREVAHTTANKPQTGEGWGYGKVDAWAGLKTILDKTSVIDIIETAPESIMVKYEGGSYAIYAPGQESLRVSVVDLSGRAVKQFTTDGDSATLSTQGLPTGMYIMCIEGSHSSRSLKIAVK